MSTQKVVLLTYNTPTVENVSGASALPYHLLAKRDEKVNVVVLTFNANRISDTEIKKIEEQLHVKIECGQLPSWYKWMDRLHLLFLRVFLRLPFLCYIKLSKEWKDKVRSLNPDLIWVYGEELLGVVKLFPEYHRVHLGPDTESLYYYRMMRQRFVMSNALDYWKCALMYRKYARMERELPAEDNYTYLAVGEEDVQHLQELNPKVKAKFLRHPHYEVRGLTPNPSPERKGRFYQPKIKLLIAGQYNLYMNQTADELFEEMKSLPPNPIPADAPTRSLSPKGERRMCLQDYYTITFLGKGWEKHVEALRSAGWEVEHIKFAPNYIEEICKHDIQITPIAIGTGTKGKVLDALANGLLVIGTPYAMENIEVEHGVSCIEYREPQEVMDVLSDIITNREKYEVMAMSGREAVLKYHDRRLLAEELFSL